MKVRAFCFTLNNPKAGDLDAIKALPRVKYGIIGNEVGESETPHLQGYLYFSSPRTVSGVIKLLKKTCKKAAHVEAARGSPKANKAYCSKGDDFVEWGEFPSQGKRADLVKAADMLRSGSAMAAVAEALPSTYIRYHKGLEKLQGLHLKEVGKGWRPVEVVLLKGPTGCGKTRRAMEEAGYKIDGCGLQWWDGYEGEKCILIDEYANNVKITELLTILDGHQKRLAIKGGFTYACWNKVFITTNLRELHEAALPEHRDALQRRITQVHDYFDLDSKCCKFKGTLACDCFVFQ
mgnify:CR=1 FL=1